MDQAQNALELALAKVRALEMFPVIELAALLVSLVLLQHVLRQYLGREARQTLKPARFVIFSIVIAGLTGAFSALWGFANAPMALAFSIGLCLSLVDPAVAVCFLLANTLLRPWEVTEISAMSFIPKMLGALAIFSWLFHGARSGKLSILMNWPSRFFIALSGWVLFSAVTTDEFMHGLTAYSNTMMVASILFILAANVPSTQGDLRLIEKVLAISITGVVGHALAMTVSRAGYNPALHRLEGIGLTGNANDLAALTVQALPLAVIPALGPGRRFYRKALASILVPVLLAGLWLAESRGAILALGAASVGYFVIRAKNPRRAVLVALLCAPLLFAVVSIMSLARNADDIQGSTESRFGYVVAGLKMAAHNPILGVGYNNYPKLYETYASGDMTYEWGERTAHSTWVLALAETGVTGFLLLVGLFISTFKRAWRVRRSHPELFAALIGYSIAMTFLSHTYTFFPYLLFALVLAAAKLDNQKI